VGQTGQQRVPPARRGCANRPCPSDSPSTSSFSVPHKSTLIFGTRGATRPETSMAQLAAKMKSGYSSHSPPAMMRRGRSCRRWGGAHHLDGRLPLARKPQDWSGQVQPATTVAIGLAYDFFRFLRRPLLGHLGSLTLNPENEMVSCEPWTEIGTISPLDTLSTE